MLQPALRDSTALQSYIDVSNQFYQDLLGYKPGQTSLQILAKEQWQPFCERVGLNLDSLGIYLPRNQTAVIPSDSETATLSLFHEYFGHGLFCEQNLSGKRLIELEKKLLEEEKQEFQRRQFTLEDVQSFRNKNQTFQELGEFKRQNLEQYELFAIWTEYLLSRKFGLRDKFEKRHDSLQNGNKENFDSVINFSRQYGDLAVFYAFGLRKIQSRKRLLRLSQDIFKNKLDRTRLILHFGSGKEFSDIDLFVISNDIPSTYDSWLDVRAYKTQNIEEGIRVLNPMITDPIIIGKLVFGNTNYWRRLKQQVLAQSITEEAINFSLREYRAEMRRSRDKSLGEHLQMKNLRSAKTFLTNALALKNGDKVLTFNRLIDYAQKRLLSNEKFIELKGGIE